MGAFKSAVNGLYTVITAIRIIAVAFLVIQTVLLLTQEKGSLPLDKIKLK